MSMTKKIISFYLEDIDTPVGRAINLWITFLVLLSSSIFVTQTYKIPSDLRNYLNIIDDGILVIFVIEYGLRLWCAESKVKYLFSFYSLVDLISIFPFLLGFLDTTFLRIFRWFRILRLVRFIQKGNLFSNVSREDTVIVVQILFTLFAIIFVYSGLIYQFEHPANPQVFRTFLDAVYFAVVTMTTVGFGDVTPISQAGRLMTVLMILTGITLIPWQVGDLIKQFVKNNRQVKTMCPTCSLYLHDADAIFCKLCGTKLEKL